MCLYNNYKQIYRPSCKKRYNIRILTLVRKFSLFQTELISLWVSKDFSTPVLNFYWDLISIWRFVSFQLFSTQLNLKGSRLGH